MAQKVLVDLLSFTGTKGGMETYTRELYAQFGAMETGFEFIGFASTEGQTRDLSWFPGEIIDSRISGERRVEWAIGELFRVGRRARRIGVDLVHSPATLGPMRTSMPTVVTMHDMLYWSHPELMATARYIGPVKWMERRAAGNATRIMTDSEQSAREIVKYLGFDEQRLHVVYLASGPGRVDPEARRPEPGLVLATGNRLPHKNYDGLIRALALLEPAHRPKLVVTGSRGDDPLRPVVDELALHDWVELKGWVSDEELDDLYARATAFAVPSFCEGFSLPVLEGMQAGIPVIASDIEVHHEVGGTAATYFDPHDHADIARVLSLTVDEPSRLQAQVQPGLEQAARFSWRRTARESLEVFRAALEDRG